MIKRRTMTYLPSITKSAKKPEMRWCSLSSFNIVFLLLLVLNGLAMAARGSITTQTQPNKVLSPVVDLLSFTHYLHTCPDAEAIIQNKVRAWVKNDSTLAPSIIRLHFHDCAVRGCDASVLLNHAGSERRAEASRTLRGFQLIDDIKAEIEKMCPETVSCADILTAAARDATVLIGGPFWEVPFGRKDGEISIAGEANRQVPQGRENVTALINFFQSLGLNVLDLVILSGSHTIGRSTCSSIQRRLYDFNGSHRSDPSLNSTYLRLLKRKCGRTINYNYIDLDGTTPREFDNEYYKNLEKKMGLLSTDQRLYADSRTSSIVEALATQPELFTNQFAVSMVKLGNVHVLTGKNEGEIRRNCNFVNPRHRCPK